MGVSGTSTFQQRYAGHDVLEVSLEWRYGAIAFLSSDVHQKSELVIAHRMRNEQGYYILQPTLSLDARLSPTFRPP